MIPTPPKTGDLAHMGKLGLQTSLQAVLPQALAKSSAAKWDLARESFAETLARSVEKRFGNQVPPEEQLRIYILGLHLEDLALACACADGMIPAWEHFVATYQSYLRASAAAILRCPASSPAACDLADSLFADLYGLNEKARSRSLFRYFHGRSSLKTWLRAVLAQRHIDAIRASRRVVSIDDEEQRSAVREAAESIAAHDGSSGVDPDRQQYLELFRRTLELALSQLDPRDKNRLRLYYSEEQTLAEIGKALSEHESSVSRNLERTRRELRQQIEQALREGEVTSDGRAQKGLSDAQIALCFEYAAQDAPIDFDKLFPAPTAPLKPILKATFKTKGREP